MALAGVAQLVGVLSCELEDHEFDSQSKHLPGLWVWFLVRARSSSIPLYERQLFDASISRGRFSPSLPPSFPLSLKSISMSLGKN